MSDDYESDESELFEVGEMIVLTLKDGRHYLGEYVGFYDTGVAIKVEAKTAFRIEKASDNKFEKLVQEKTEAKLSKLLNPSDWYREALALNPNEIQINILRMTVEQVIEMVTSQIRAEHRKWAAENWTGPIQEQDVTEPYLKELKRSVRMLVMWDKIDEVCSAVELAEEAEIADLTNLMDSEDFFRLIEGK